MGVSIKIYNPQQTANRICKDEKTGLFVAQTWRRYFNPYVPMDTGMLSTDVTCEPFKIIYNVPYAHRIYTGDDFDFKKEKHPLACARWDEPAKKAKGNAVAKEIQEYLRK
jgi:hypothetical protein